MADIWIVSRWAWGGGGDDDREVVSAHWTEAEAVAAVLDADYRVDRLTIAAPPASGENPSTEVADSAAPGHFEGPDSTKRPAE